jgi:DNA-binding NarL/FixJ family response regulator
MTMDGTAQTARQIQHAPTTSNAISNATTNGGQALAMRAPLPRLTPTQIKVLRGVHSGLLNKQIAFDLGIAEATVKAHMTALMRKLNVRNRTQVAVLAHTLMLQAA